LAPKRFWTGYATAFPSVILNLFNSWPIIQ